MVNQVHTFFLHFYVTIALLLIKHQPRTLFWTVLCSITSCTLFYLFQRTKSPAVPYFSIFKETNYQM